MTTRYQRVVILGGSGFCGAHFAEHLIAERLAERVLLVDLHAPNFDRSTARFTAMLNDRRIEFFPGDVRGPLELPPGPVDLIANFAAVHREPGHADHEYFATNVPGAMFACALAARVECKTMLFASSIAPYGPATIPVDERSTPAPISAYGASKLEAERVHQMWAAEDPTRKLVIVRPGVVFGPGEGGNVTRLVRSVARRRFVHVGSSETRKAGLYVGEFVRASLWLLERAPQLANLTMHPAPTVDEYVHAAQRVLGLARNVPTIPLWLAMGVASIVSTITRVFGGNSEWHPERIRKLARSNHIVPRALLDAGYEFHYTLDSAMREWHALRPDEWE
jgi:nucleoside-diphosphate-sugar epimerase